jgi:hypothetical protein|tara:strand:+ start:2633 stop:3019 length:387 start_codon:yes stop_codon:yes gene_type:complete
MPRGIFIPGNVPSSKNGRRWTGRYFIVSKQTATYYKTSKKYWIDNKEEFLKLLKGKNSKNKKPYRISFKFVRKSKHKFDYINPAQTIQDEMTKYGWIDDDNADEIIPIFLEYEYSKDNPGVYINVLKS